MAAKRVTRKERKKVGDAEQVESKDRQQDDFSYPSLKDDTTIGEVSPVGVGPAVEAPRIEAPAEPDVKKAAAPEARVASSSLSAPPRVEPTTSSDQSSQPTSPGTATVETAPTKFGMLHYVTIAVLAVLAGYLCVEALVIQTRGVVSLPLATLIVNSLKVSPAIAEYSIITVLVAEIATTIAWVFRISRPYVSAVPYVQPPVVSSTAIPPTAAPTAAPTVTPATVQAAPVPAVQAPPTAAEAEPIVPLARAVEPRVVEPPTPEPPAPEPASPVTRESPTEEDAPKPEASKKEEGDELAERKGNGLRLFGRGSATKAEEVAAEPRGKAAKLATLSQQTKVPAVVVPPPRRQDFIKTYPITKSGSDVYVGIEKNANTGACRYVVMEPTLTPSQERLFDQLKNLLIDELDVDVQSLKDSGKAEQYLTGEVKKVAAKYGIKINPVAAKKLAYKFTRDFIKLGRIEPLMNDPLIEDISCDGPGIPLYIWHRDYESIPTNIVFKDDEELNSFASKLAYVSKKHISIANPMVDATLPDGSRIQITYGREITKKGSTFTIRKFKADPLTIVDLVKGKAINAEVAAYLWYLIEKRLSMVIAGGTASGKTTTLNSLSMFIPPDQKIVSVEDTPELNMPHENWIQSVSRGGTSIGEITLFDLLRAALRQRPDIIIVGEVRGAEAFTLFQAIATGHGGLGTIHADSVEAAITRLTSEPMNVPKSLLGATLDLVVMQLKIKMGDTSVRRAVHIVEVVGYEPNSEQIVLNDAFRWDPSTDRFVFSGRSRLFEKITKRYGTPLEKIRKDVEDRRLFIMWLMNKNVRGYKELSQLIREFYASPSSMLERVRRELQVESVEAAG